MRSLAAEVAVSLSLLGIGAAIAYVVSPLFESASADTLYVLGAVAIGVPAIAILALRARRDRRP